MTSTSSGGGSVITLEFSLNESIDIAQQDVQSAINAGFSYLPKDLPNPPVYSKVNPADAPILTLALTSDTVALSKVEDLADTILAQKDFAALGRRSRLDQRRPKACRAHPGQSRPRWPATGSRSRTFAPRLAPPTSTRPRVRSAARARPSPSARTISCFRARTTRNVIIAYRNGSPVRLSDVANSVDSAENLYQAAWMGKARRQPPRHA